MHSFSEKPLVSRKSVQMSCSCSSNHTGVQRPVLLLLSSSICLSPVIAVFEPRVHSTATPPVAGGSGCLGSKRLTTTSN